MTEYLRTLADDELPNMRRRRAAWHLREAVLWMNAELETVPKDAHEVKLIAGMALAGSLYLGEDDD